MCILGNSDNMHKIYSSLKAQAVLKRVAGVAVCSWSLRHMTVSGREENEGCLHLI